MRIGNKFLGITLAVTMMAGLTACGDSSDEVTVIEANKQKDSGEDQGSNESGGQSGESEDQSAKDTAEDKGESADGTGDGAGQTDEVNAQDESSASASSSDTPQILHSTEYIYDTDESGKYDETLCTGRIESLTMSRESAAAFTELNSSFSEYMDGKVKQASDARTEYSDSNKEYRAGITADETDPFIYSAYVYLDHYIKRLDSKYMSVLTSFDTYAGGAHGYNAYTGANFDVATGKAISFGDVIKDEKAFSQTLAKDLVMAYGEDAFFAVDTDSGIEGQIDMYVANAVHPENPQPDEYGNVMNFEWTLDADGVTIYFNAYDIAPYAYGTIVDMIPYKSGLINDAFIPDENCSIVSGLPKYMDIYTDTDGDGFSEKFELRDVADDYNAGDSSALVVKGANGEKQFESYFSGYKAYLVRAAGSQFILVDMAGMNDWHELCTFRLDGPDVSDPTLLDVSSAGGFFDEAKSTYYDFCITDSRSVILANRLNLLSTYDGVKTYHFMPDGTIASDEAFFTINAYNELKSVEPIECELVDESGKVTGKETVPAGSSYTFVRTNGSDFVDMRIDDGRLVRLTLEADEENWGHKIGGVNAEKLFEQLFYAG